MTGRAWNSTLRPGKPLGRRTPLKTTTGLSRKPQSAPTGSESLRKAPRDTGPSRSARALVLERDGYRCLRCGKPCGPGIGPYSIQHRKARGVGGDNSLCNLILLDGTATTGCHGEVESRHDPHDQAAGWRLESWEDPARCGVLVVSAGGGGVLVWLEPDGGVLFEPPVGAA